MVNTDAFQRLVGGPAPSHVQMPQQRSPGQVASDAFASFGTQTGQYLDKAFNQLPLPVLTGQEIAQHWENAMTPKGVNDYKNDPVYRELTDPVNYVLPAAAKAGKVLGMAIDPLVDGAGAIVKGISNSNRAQKTAAKALQGM